MIIYGDITESATSGNQLAGVKRAILSFIFLHIFKKGSAIYVYDELSTSKRVLCPLWELPRLPLHL